ncbi:MAG: hypothetical protein HRT73_09060 [Flavobacteriales bacterium]|nr:hypothetical protein [Flavobacteriales bacterium]
MKKLEEQIRDIYDSKSLSIVQLELIKNKTLRNNKSIIKSISHIFKYAAIFILILGVCTLFIYPKHQQNIIINNFAEEIAIKHQRQVPSEFLSNSIIDLNSKMKKLNFNLILPKRNIFELELIGAKYCSVNNRIAAKLELKNRSNETVTCYVFKKTEKFNFDNQVNSNNSTVTFWDNNDVIFALAQNN